MARKKADNEGNIIEGLRGLRVDIDTLNFDPVNARKHDDRNIDAVRSSLAAFGQRKPIVVQKEGMIVRAGNGTLRAAKELGWTSIAAVMVDEDNITAVQYAIADNRTAELASWDNDVLAGLLGEMSDQDRQMLAFDDFDMANLLAQIDGDLASDANDPNAEWTGMPEFDHVDQTAFKKVTLNFASQEDVDRFNELTDSKIREKTISIWWPHQSPEYVNSEFAWEDD